MLFNDWLNLQYGDSISFVFQVVIRGQSQWVVNTVDKPVQKVTLDGMLPQSDHGMWTILEAKVSQVKPLKVSVGEVTTLHAIGPCTNLQLCQVVEMCCGVGAFSSVASSVGFQVLAGVDFNSKWEPLFLGCHGEGASFVAGDCGDVSVVRRLFSLGAEHAVCLAGVSCQPFSQAGDRRGLSDPRSASLFHCLRSAWLLQCPLVVLECTPEIYRDSRAQAVLSTFASATGCHLTQTVLSLQEVWCTKRERWYAVFSAAPLGPVHIPPVPVVRPFDQVGLVMPFVKQWPQDEMAQLELSLYELSKFYTFASGGVERAFLDLRGLLPTLLHSHGNQLYDCQCGCRKALSLDRLRTRGLFGTLVALEGSVWHDSQTMVKSRYLHPREMFLLQGGSPDIDWGSNLRLAMAGIGQCVSPIHAVWILSQLRVAIQTFCGDPCVVPAQLLEEHVDRVLDARDDWWPTPMNQADFCPGECALRVWDHDTHSMISFKCGPGSTLDSFHEAQHRSFLAPHGQQRSVPPPTWIGGVAAEDLTQSLSWAGDVSIGEWPRSPSKPDVVPCDCMDFALESGAPSGSHVSPTLPFEVVAPSVKVNEVAATDCLTLIDTQAPALKKCECPRISSLAGLSSLLARVLPVTARQQILVNQGDLWADDELRFFLGQVVLHGPPDQHLVAWDPLALSGVIRYANFSLLNEMVASVPSIATVVSACMIEGHWYAVCWRCQNDSVLAFTCGHPCGVSVALQKVHQEFCRTRGCTLVPLTFRAMPFVVDSCCGALAVAYLRHLVFGSVLPETKSALTAFHASLRSAFAGGLPEHIPRPWIWGAGEQTWVTKLEFLLQEHGVPVESTPERAKQVIAKLGESKVAKAIGAPNPWKDLKWLANSQSPAYQLIQPSELRAAIEKRVRSERPVGVKSQKMRHHRAPKDNGVAKAVDPAGLRFEQGLFECGLGCALNQLDIAHVGPNASGIVLTSLAAALPFLKGGRQVSAGGLGFLVVDCVPTQVPTVLIPEPIRVPAICVANSEPVLLDAVLYQLGAQPVARKQVKGACSIVTQASHVVKVMAYRDQLDVAWEEFVRHPMKYVFSKVPPLKECDDPNCDGSCESWHVSPGCSLSSPLMEVWGRQWILTSFTQTPPAQAEVFTFHARVPSLLATQLANLQWPVRGIPRTKTPGRKTGLGDVSGLLASSTVVPGSATHTPNHAAHPRPSSFGRLAHCFS